ncbi:alpha/beta fold hydrolase [Saliphagus sp. GCM10025334]
MRHRIFNDEGEEDLVFVMGFGNRWTHENVSWLVGTLANAGYRVHAFELPTNIDDFKADWLEPVAEYVVDLEDYQLLAHSAGSLVAQALDGADNHVYLSPWWGYNERVPNPVLDLLSQIPTSAPFLPRGETDRSAIGDLATDHQLATSPKWVSPSFVRETRRAQGDLLAIDHDAVVFCSLKDPIIDHQPIGERVPPEHVVLYDGGHELFSSSVRDQYVGLLLTALEGGADAIEAAHGIYTLEASDDRGDAVDADAGGDSGAGADDKADAVDATN